MLENEYFYELKYVYKDKVVSMKFNGEKTLDNLVTNLQDFLKSCGWAEDSVIRQVRTESDIYEEDEKNKKEEIKSDYNLNITYTDNNDYYRKSYDEDYIDG